MSLIITSSTLPLVYRHFYNQCHLEFQSVQEIKNCVHSIVTQLNLHLYKDIRMHLRLPQAGVFLAFALDALNAM